MVCINNTITLCISFRKKANSYLVGCCVINCNFYPKYVWYFLVRSGILNSVHTFANDPERGLYILIFLFILIFLSFFIFLIFHKSENNNSKTFYLLSKETSILVNNWFMMYFLSVVLIGTIYPIFLEVISSQKISVGPPFFNKLILPFFNPIYVSDGNRT